MYTKPFDITDARLAKTPEPPYIAVIFTNVQNRDNLEGYGQTAEDMVRLALKADGCLGYESAHDRNGTGITVSYWRDEAAVKKWKAHADHITAQKAGQKQWYRAYITRVASVTRDYGFERTP